MEHIVKYHGYTLEITSVAIDVIDPRQSMYIATKVSLRDAMRAIHRHRKFIRVLESARLDNP